MWGRACVFGEGLFCVPDLCASSLFTPLISAFFSDTRNSDGTGSIRKHFIMVSIAELSQVHNNKICFGWWVTIAIHANLAITSVIRPNDKRSNRRCCAPEDDGFWFVSIDGQFTDGRRFGTMEGEQFGKFVKST